MFRLHISLICLLAGTPIMRAQAPDAAAGISDARQVDVFLAELQRASRTDDRAAMVALIEYPVTIIIDGLRVPFADPKELLERYEAVFTPALQETIARAVGVDRAEPGRDRLTVNARGIVIGTNAVLISEVDGRLKIASIVVPHADRDSDVAEAVSAAPPARVDARFEPRRVGIRIGRRATRFSGALAAGTPDAYLVLGTQREGARGQVGARQEWHGCHAR